MEASARDWVGHIAGVVTLASFVGGLSLALRVHRARSSSGVSFGPLAAAALCCHAWLLYGRAARQPGVVWVNAWGLPLVLLNAAAHRAYARTSGPGWALLGALASLQLAAGTRLLSVTWLARIASVATVACNAAPLARVRSSPLPDLAAWALVVCSLWAAYGALLGDAALCLCNLLGALVAVAELAAAAIRRHKGRRPATD